MSHHMSNVLLYVNQNSRPNLVMLVSRIRSILEIKIIISTCLHLNDHEFHEEMEIDDMVLIINDQIIDNETNLLDIIPANDSIATMKLIKPLPYVSHGILYT